jgi:hypothetical protein
MTLTAILQENINNPPMHTVTRGAHYNVNPGSSPTFVAFSGTVSRFAVKFDTRSLGIGISPYKVQISYRHVGTPTGQLFD